MELEECLLLLLLMPISDCAYRSECECQPRMHMDGDRWSNKMRLDAQYEDRVQAVGM
jgi:hypothetical protein